jgi:hypothetical protein
VHVAFFSFFTHFHTICFTHSRYARWSLGFVDPPLEIAGTGQKCTIRALNDRGKVLLSAVENAMKQLQNDGVLQSLNVAEDKVDVTIVPPSEVGTFSEEDRSRQVRFLFMFVLCFVRSRMKCTHNS